MQSVSRPLFALLLLTSLTAPAFAATAKEVEYKQSDTNFYWKGDVLKAEPSAVILTAGSFRHAGDSYFYTPRVKAPKEIYLQVTNDWIEPITPPGATSMNVPSDAIQIREPQGDVQVAYPTAPTTFLPVQDGMTIANGTVVKTGANGTAAVVFGGVASARLTPNSEAAVQQTLAPQLRTTEIDLTKGGVFSKVGKPVNEKEDYTVHTPFAVAAARGTDFVSLVMPARTDVWIAQGTVQVTQVDGTTVGSVSSDGGGALKIIRFPVMADSHQAMMASAETMTAAMNFIPLANQKIKALRDQAALGVKLTPSQEKYLSLIKKVPCLIKLTLVEPPPAPMTPPPAPTTVAAPVVPVPLPTTSPAYETMTPVPPPASGPAPLEINLLKDGNVEYKADTLTLDQLKTSLNETAKTTPGQPLVIRGKEVVSKEQLKEVLAICHEAKLNKITYAKHGQPADSSSTAPATSTPTPTPVPAPVPVPMPKPVAAASPPPAPVVLTPINLNLRADGKVDFQGSTLSLDDLKPKLDDIAKATPTQPILIEGRELVAHDQVHKVVALCHAAKLKVKVDKTKPLPKPMPAPVATTPPVPAMPPPPPPAPVVPQVPATQIP